MNTYERWDTRLTGRCSDRRKVANNTYLERRADDIALRLHNTDIMTASPDGWVTLNTGGWHTVTTKARLNAFMSFGRIYQKNFRWFFSGLNEEIPFRDGMKLNEITLGKNTYLSLY
jgi:hypothetical protein